MSETATVFQDKTLKCRDCGADFVFSGGEQAFFKERGLLNEPQRCQPCRATRRRERNSGTREQHEVICADCGVPTTVPFVPRNERPVYCSSCYERRRGQPAE
ncbi:MAG: zinc-ribbon domain containing protein [Chloroflexota bacterium]